MAVFRDLLGKFANTETVTLKADGKVEIRLADNKGSKVAIFTSVESAGSGDLTKAHRIIYPPKD